MSERAVKDEPETPEYVPDHLKTEEICERAAEDYGMLTSKVKPWHDDDDCYDADKLIEWYDGYKKRKTLKAKIKEELLPIAWHP